MPVLAPAPMFLDTLVRRSRLARYLVVLVASLVAGVPLGFVAARVWQQGVGLNQPTLIVVLALIAAFGAAVQWVQSGQVTETFDEDTRRHPSRIRWDRLQQNLRGLFYAAAIILSATLVTLFYVHVLADWLPLN